MSKYGMTDSGKRQSFGKGMAIRDTADDKPRPDLISPFAEERQGHWLRMARPSTPSAIGKTGCRSRAAWPRSKRHVMKYQQGKRDEDHLAAIMFNAMALIHYEEMIERGRLPAGTQRHAQLPGGREDEESPQAHQENPQNDSEEEPWLIRLCIPACHPQRLPDGGRGLGDDRHPPRPPRNHPDRRGALGLRLQAPCRRAAVLHARQAGAP